MAVGTKMADKWTS